MKKALKKVIALALTLLMALSSVSAFAASEKTDLLWDYYSEGIFEKYYYNGELMLGDNTVNAKNGETLNYFIFDTDKSGYYAFEFNPKTIDFVVTPEYMQNGRAIDIDWAVTVACGGTNTIMLYMDKGENIVGAYFENKSASGNVSVEFIGETITDIQFEEDAFKDLVIDADIYTLENEKEHFILLDATVNFSSGKEIELTDYHFFFTTEEPIAAGTVDFNLEFYNFTNKYTATVRNITDYIANIEFIGLEETGYAAVGYQDFSCSAPASDGFKVTYTDGTTETIDNIESCHPSASVTLENGRTYSIFASPLLEDDCKVYWGIEIAGHYFQKVPFEVTKNTMAEDLSYFGNSVKNNFVDYGAEIGSAINTVINNSFTLCDFIRNVVRLFKVIFTQGGDLIDNITENTSRFIEFHAK